ncbi:MAG: histidinol phosphate phosphatase, partial [Rhodospirillaceae bacterium]|nr:histidinol phosphate phosphatase [Rhodospirillaceae bacterium]
AMRAIIEAECPDHGIRGEEFPEKTGAGEWNWYLDPIDGTKLFITGIPLFGTLIALARNGKPVLGIMDQAISGERWVGAMDGTASLNGAAIKTSNNEDISTARLFTTSMSYYGPEQLDGFNRLSEAVSLNRMGTDCYAFAMLATGFVDMVTEGYFNEWDIAALVPIIENAGGVVTDWDGAPLRFEGQVAINNVIAAANPGIHAKALAILQGK